MKKFDNFCLRISKVVKSHGQISEVKSGQIFALNKKLTTPLVGIPGSLWVQIVQKGSDLSPTTSWDLFYLRSEPRMLRSEPTTLGSEMKKIPTCS